MHLRFPRAICLVLLFCAASTARANPLTGCFDALITELETRSQVAGGTFTIKQEKTIAKLLILLAKESPSLLKDVKLLGKLAKRLQKAFPADGTLGDLISNTTDCLSSEVQNGRDDLADYVTALPEIKATARVQKGLTLADLFLGQSVTETNPSLLAKLLSKALAKIKSGWKATLKIPELVVADVSGFQFVPTEKNPGSYFPGSGLLFITAFQYLDDERTRYNIMDSTVTVDSGEGIYPLSPDAPEDRMRYLPNQGFNCTFDCPAYRSATGALTVTWINTEKRFIEGTFEFEAVKSSGAGPANLSITKGWFRLKFEKD